MSQGQNGIKINDNEEMTQQDSRTGASLMDTV